MENTILFSIPDYWNNFNLNMDLLNLFETEREKFYDNIKIDSCYGSFPCIWNGGRYIEGSCTFEEMQTIVDTYKLKKVSLRHTFTNSLINEYDVYDRVGNTILSLTHNGHNGVNISSKILEKYITDRFPDFYLLYSTTLSISTVEDINRVSKDHIVVPDYSVNNNFELLKQLEHPENIEILVGEACIDRCPNRKEHHKLCGKMQIVSHINSNFICPNGCEGDYYYYDYIPKREHYVSMESIQKDYLPLGINKFKISGRNDPQINVVERYVNYLVKPKYKDDIRNKLLIKSVERMYERR